METNQTLDLFGDPPPPAPPPRQRSAAPATGREAGKLGIERSVDRADRAKEGWSSRALEELRLYARIQTEPFTIEQARDSIVMDEPTDGRAWGAVTQAAIRRGILAKTGGYAPAESSNGSPKALYLPGANAHG